MLLSYQVAEAVHAGRLEVVLLGPSNHLQGRSRSGYPTIRLLSAKVRAFVEHVVSTCNWMFVDV